MNRNTFPNLKLFLFILVIVLGGIFFIRILFFLIINYVDQQTYSGLDNKIELKKLENMLDCPKSDSALELTNFSTNDFTINIPIALSKKDSSLFASPTWIFACKYPGDKTKGLESVRLYIETAHSFDSKTLQSNNDCITYYKNLYSNNDNVTTQLVEVEFDTFSIEYNKCYFKYLLNGASKNPLIFERLMISPAYPNSVSQQFVIYAYYPTNTPLNLTNSLNKSVNSFKLNIK